MKEIKFRAWDKTSQNMIMDYAHIGMFGELYTTTFHDSAYSDIGTPDLILLQYTGLTDKNGKEIYDGDKLHAIRTEMVVEWGDKIGAWVVTLGKQRQILGSFNSRVLTIIGNIHEME